MKNNFPVNNRFKNIRESAKSSLLLEIEKSLKEIKETFPDNPEGMGYFYKKFSTVLKKTSGIYNGKDVIGIMCIQVPEELIYAVGAIPVRICSGAYSMEQAETELLSPKACPLIKSTMESLYLNIFANGIEPLMIINPTTCDQKKKIGEIEKTSRIPFYTLELPPSKDTEEAIFYWQSVVKKLAKKLENVTGQKLTRKRLKKAISIVSLAQAQFRRFYNIRKKWPVILGKDAILVSNAYFFDDIISWTYRLSLLNDELDDRAMKKQYIVSKKAPRIFLTGSPSIFPNMKIPVLIEQLGGIIVAEEFCSSGRLLYDTVAVDEWSLHDMIPALADRYLKPCTCPSFTPNIDRERKILTMVKDFFADGVIYQSFTGCQLYHMEAKRVEKILEKYEIPMLYIETDYAADNTGQLTTRVEAFMELLQNKIT
ncbi:MAG TPA: 2-hydroxyacyl-CoA dehydratase [Desulfobacteraceae bacterium]|nr:2-hydroxyacyl-CoA dehydratase [Desulfobacteraceae bacterium]